MDNKIALITGATSGFGRAIANTLASKGYALIITGRRVDRLMEVKKHIEDTYHVPVVELPFDIRQQTECEMAINSLSSEWRSIDVLINNAGLAAGRDSIEEGQLADWEQMIDTNIKGLLYITRLVSPLMKERKSGHIINIGSIAGREAYAGGNVYSATKFAVDGLTRSMRIDLAPYGIKVGQIAPGAAETEFSVVRFHGDRDKANAVYAGFTPLDAQDIAETVWFIISRPPHVNIQDVLIMPTAQPSASIIHRQS